MSTQSTASKSQSIGAIILEAGCLPVATADAVRTTWLAYDLGCGDRVGRRAAAVSALLVEADMSVLGPACILGYLLTAAGLECLSEVSVWCEYVM